MIRNRAIGNFFPDGWSHKEFAFEAENIYVDMLNTYASININGIGALYEFCTEDIVDVLSINRHATKYVFTSAEEAAKTITTRLVKVTEDEVFAQVTVRFKHNQINPINGETRTVVKYICFENRLCDASSKWLICGNVSPIARARPPIPTPIIGNIDFHPWQRIKGLFGGNKTKGIGSK